MAKHQASLLAHNEGVAMQADGRSGESRLAIKFLCAFMQMQVRTQAETPVC